MVTIINPGTGPVVYDADGHSVGGGERRGIKKLDDVGQLAVDHGHLLLAEEVEQDTKDDQPATSDSARRGGKS